MPAERFPAQAEKERYLNVASPVVFARDVLDSGSMPVFRPQGLLRLMPPPVRTC